MDANIARAERVASVALLLLLRQMLTGGSVQDKIRTRVNRSLKALGVPGIPEHGEHNGLFVSRVLDTLGFER